VDAVDALHVLSRAAGLQPYAACVDAGNVKCDDGIDAADAMYILQYVAGLTVNLPAGCPAIGSPSTVETTLTQAASAGDTEIQVASQDGLAIGDQIRIDAGTAEEEDNQIAGFGSVLLQSPLQYSHAIGASVIAFKQHIPFPPLGPIPNVTFYSGPGPLPLQAMPPETSPGDDFTFTLAFKNAGTGLGYGPYIDLLLPTIGIDDESSNGPCDGIWFVKAEALFTSPPTFPLTTVPATGSGHTIFPTTVTPPSIDCGSPASVASIGGPITPFTTHPLGGTFPPAIWPPIWPSTSPQAPGGFELVVIPLPFGSYSPSQGITYVNVTAHLSNFADAGKPLTILARGGFQFGSSPLGTVPPVPKQQPYFDKRATTPTPFTIKKVCTLLNGTLCPENETATGPNFPMDYVISVHIDNGLTIKNLTVDDILPDNVHYDNHLQVTVLGLPASLLTAHSPPCKAQPPTTDFPVAVSAPTGPGAGGLLEATLCSPITGTGAPADVVITFQFYIPAKDANGLPILDAACDPVKAINDINARGEWDPIDPRDAPLTVISDVTHADHTLYKKCIALQKTATPAVVIPGDTITYTLNFQISDYLQMDNLVINDLLSDGQHYVANSAILSVSDKTGSLPAVTVPATYVNAVTNAYPCPGATPWPFPGGGGLPHIGTTVTFSVSAALINLYSGPSATLSAGTLTGGQIPPPGAPGAIGTLTFQTKVQDTFDCPVFPGADQFVDKFDVLYDYATITGNVIARADGVSPPPPPPPPPTTAQDNSGVVVPVAGDTIAKCIYSVVRGGINIVPPPGYCPLNPNAAPPQIAPGDLVTFRITKTIPSGDHEGIDITDFLPHPVLQPAPITSGPGPSNTCPPGVPAPNPPSIADNSLTFHYPPGNDPNNQPCVIDILLSAEVTGDPYADGLLFTNEVRECEQNSLGATICQTAIAPIVLTEPRLRITKGVVAACQPDPNGACVKPSVGTFTPPLTGQVPFNNPGATIPWGSTPSPFMPNITSNVLAANPITSNVNVDAGDIVTFAVIVENYGTGLNGAFHVTINDLPALPRPGFGMPPGPLGYNLSVYDGTGLPFTCGGVACTAAAFFSPGGIQLDDPGPTQGALSPYSPTSGHNIAVITYSLQVMQLVPMDSCFINKASILNYAGIANGPNNGPNHVGTPYGGPYNDTAQVCTRPTVAKSIVSTSEAHTGPVNGVEQLAIGEIIRYQLDIVVPEGSSSSFQVRDLLPAGLSYIPGATTTLAVTNASGTFGIPLPTMNVIGGTFSCLTPGTDPIFDFGPLTNGDQDPDQEHILIQFNALGCNIAANQDGVHEDNSAQVLVNNKVVVTSNTVPAVIVEPNVTITKTVAPNPQQTGNWIYTITLTSNGTADAFDVHMTDVLPQNCVVVGSPAWTPSPPPPAWAAAISSTINSVNITISHFPKLQAQGIQFTAKCGKPCDNSAQATWTSLPGTGTSPNPTGSSTPGASGAINGERDGSGGVNDYAASTGTTGCTPAQTKVDLAGKYYHPPLAGGSTGSYGVELTNLGLGTITSVTFDDTLPAGVTYLGVIPPSTTSPASWSCNSLVHCTFNGSLPPGSVVRLWIAVSILSAPPNQNCATVTLNIPTNFQNGQPAGNQATICTPP
jgi:uncharacterized repeat protein (TIGR01451 family)